LIKRRPVFRAEFQACGGKEKKKKILFTARERRRAERMGRERGKKLSKSWEYCDFKGKQTRPEEGKKERSDFAVTDHHALDGRRTSGHLSAWGEREREMKPTHS